MADPTMETTPAATPANAKAPATTRFVVRGGDALPSQELSGHLALALRLENIGVLLGAGASVAAGGQTINQLWKGLEASSPQTLSWLRKNKYVDEGGSPNIEEVLSLLAISERDLQRSGGDASETIQHSKAITGAVLQAAMLSEHLWKNREAAQAQDILEPYRRMLARLQASRQPGQAAPWLFTTNYDLSVDWAAEALGIHVVNGFSGLHDRQFRPNAFDLSLLNSQAVGEARFGSYNLNVVKMHGSLNWLIRDGGDVIEVPCQSAEPILRDHIASKGNEKDAVLLIQPTKAKYFDTVGFVYGELIRRFTEFLARPNTALVISGYGFNDEHVNRLLASGLLNPTLQLVIYFPEWSAADQPIPNGFLKHIQSLHLPRVIICGGGEDAYFNAMTRDLPDPAMVDELSSGAKRLLSQLARNLKQDGGE